MADDTLNQVEHEHISTSLEVEQLDTNLFRSKYLYVPRRARGVFGGQVISQAVVSATNCVDPQFALHSLHCYFLLSASPALPILYYVDRLREGTSYTTRFVRAMQRGKVIFVMICSFHRSEPQHPSHQWPMPPNVPRPEEVELDKDYYRRRADFETNEERKTLFLQMIQERSKSPVEVKVGIDRRLPDGTLSVMTWFRAKVIPKENSGAAFQKCILGYMSDWAFIMVASRSLGLNRYGKGEKELAMTSSLDHVIYYYSDTFDCSDWMLYHVTSPRTGDGRGVVTGSIYTRDGTLIAVTMQEGVVRSGAGRPAPKVQSKL